MVLDASVALSWLYERSAAAEQALARQVLLSLPADPAVVPALWSWEIANGLLVAERRKLTVGSQTAEFLRRLFTLPIEIDSADPRVTLATTLDIAREHALTAYDAAYLELAVRRRAPLATLDRSLGRAAAALSLRYGS